MSDQDQLDFENAVEDSFAPEEQEPQTYRIGEREFTPDQLEPVLQFSEWANANPDNWQKLKDWEEGRLTFTPVVEPVYQPEPVYTPEPQYAPAEDLYSEDYLRGLGERTAQIQQELERRTFTEAQAAVDDGIAHFVSSHSDLSQQEVDAVLGWVGDSRVLGSIPDALPYPQKMQAVRDRLEEGYRVVFYDRAKADGAKDTVNDLQRRRRASSSSSAVSSPRVAPAPTNPSERSQAYVDEIKAALEESNN